MRKLKKLPDLIDDLEDEGLNPDQVYVDPDDVVRVESDGNESED